VNSFKKNKKIFSITLFILILILNSCSDEEKASDFEKLGAAATSGSGTIKGSVVNYSNSGALSGVSVSYSSSGSTASSSTETDDDGDYTKSLLQTSTHTLTYSKSGYLDETQSATLESENQTLTLTTVRLLPDSCDSTGDISGTISDAVNGDTKISGVTLTARKGLNVTSGTVAATATTATNGTFTMSDMARGWYSVTVTKSGYITEYLSFVSCGDVSNQDGAMSETLSSDSMRIILDWPVGSTGDDLDSHLTGPDNASSRFHIYYVSNKKDFYYATNSNTCSGCNASQISDNVSLDRDDNDGPPGTETTTISKVRDGTYRFSVFDFDNGQTSPDASSTKLATSGAKVIVYYNNSRTIYNVPNIAGTLWTVFTFTNSGGLVEVGTMGHETASANIE